MVSRLYYLTVSDSIGVTIVFNQKILIKNLQSARELIDKNKTTMILNIFFAACDFDIHDILLSFIFPLKTKKNVADIRSLVKLYIKKIFPSCKNTWFSAWKKWVLILR